MIESSFVDPPRDLILVFTSQYISCILFMYFSEIPFLVIVYQSTSLGTSSYAFFKSTSFYVQLFFLIVKYSLICLITYIASIVNIPYINLNQFPSTYPHTLCYPSFITLWCDSCVLFFGNCGNFRLLLSSYKLVNQLTPIGPRHLHILIRSPSSTSASLVSFSLKPGQL